MATGCSFVAPALVSTVGGQVPTFSFRSLHGNDYLGIQMTYMTGTSTCYGAAPTFTPYLTNSAAGYSKDCSWSYQFLLAYTGLFCTAPVTAIPAGPLTITYKNAAAISSPRAFVANFGASPAAVTVTSTTVATSNTVASTTASPLPASTVTVTQSGSAITQTSTVSITLPTVSISTVQITSCSSSSPSQSSSSSSRVSSSPSPSSSSVAQSSSSSAQASSSIPASSTQSSSASPSPSSSSVGASSSSSSANPSLSSSASPSPSSSASPSSSSSARPSSSSSASPSPSSSASPSPSSSASPSPSSSASPSPSSSASPSPSSSASPSPSSSASPSSSSSDSPSLSSSASPSPSSSASASPSSSSASASLSSSSTNPASSSSSSLSAPAPTSSISPSVSASSSASSSATPVSSSSVPSPSSTLVPTCPAADGTTFHTSQGDFAIECYIDRFDYDLAIASPAPADFAACINACASIPSCQAASYLPNGPCYLKSGLGAVYKNTNVWGVRRVSGPSSASPVSATSSSLPSSFPISCPGGNDALISTSKGPFKVECSVDRNSFDLPDSPVYPGSYENCIAACANRAGCVQVSYSIGGPCYLKSRVGNPTQNGDIIGGRLLSAALPPVEEKICPSADGKTFTTECGATYAVECASDRFGNDLPVPIAYTNNFRECLKACDQTSGCVDVSYVSGAPGPCYLKGAIGPIRTNSNVLGGRQLTGCTTGAQPKLKLHRKRVVHERRQIVNLGLAVGPDFTFVGTTTTVTQTSTSVVTTSTTTITPANPGATTTTVFTTAVATATTTQPVFSTAVVLTTVTICPTLPTVPILSIF